MLDESDAVWSTRIERATFLEWHAKYGDEAWKHLPCTKRERQVRRGGAKSTREQLNCLHTH